MKYESELYGKYNEMRKWSIKVFRRLYKWECEEWKFLGSIKNGFMKYEKEIAKKIESKRRIWTDEQNNWGKEIE